MVARGNKCKWGAAQVEGKERSRRAWGAQGTSKGQHGGAKGRTGKQQVARWSKRQQPEHKWGGPWGSLAFCEALKRGDRTEGGGEGRARHISDVGWIQTRS